MHRITMNASIGLILLMTAGPVYSVTVALTGTAVTRDTTLYENATSDNSGANDSNFAGHTGANGVRRLLLRFDLGSIPSNSVVSSASLLMSITKSAVGAPDNNHSLHKVTNSWVQGNGTGTGGAGVIVTGAASWAYRETPALAWTAAGGDFISTASATVAVGTGVNPSVVWSGNGVRTDVQSWITNSSNNHGWIIRGNESLNQSARVYGSAENSTAANRPVLFVEYAGPTSVEDWQQYR